MIFRFGTTDNELCEHPQGTGRMDRSHRRVSSWYRSAGCKASRGRAGTTASAPLRRPGPPRRRWAPANPRSSASASRRSRTGARSTTRSRAGSSPGLGPGCVKLATMRDNRATLRSGHTSTHRDRFPKGSQVKSRQTLAQHLPHLSYPGWPRVSFMPLSDKRLSHLSIIGSLYSVRPGHRGRRS